GPDVGHEPRPPRSRASRSRDPGSGAAVKSSGSSRASALILAAGQGKRMRSRVVKLLHPVGGRAAVAHVVEAALSVPVRRLVAVLGVQAGEVREAIEGAADSRSGNAGSRGVIVEFCTQTKQLGTAHAVLAAERTLRGERGRLLILNGDVPLVTP